jgi:hypothetical protein
MAVSGRRSSGARVGRASSRGRDEELVGTAYAAHGRWCAGSGGRSGHCGRGWGVVGCSRRDRRAGYDHAHECSITTRAAARRLRTARTFARRHDARVRGRGRRRGPAALHAFAGRGPEHRGARQYGRQPPLLLARRPLDCILCRRRVAAGQCGRGSAAARVHTAGARPGWRLGGRRHDRGVDSRPRHPHGQRGRRCPEADRAAGTRGLAVFSARRSDAVLHLLHSRGRRHGFRHRLARRHGMARDPQG